MAFVNVLNSSQYPRVTGEDMCEFVSAFLAISSGIHKTPQQVWNISSTGELWPVFMLYEEAVDWGLSQT